MHTIGHIKFKMMIMFLLSKAQPRIPMSSCHKYVYKIIYLFFWGGGEMKNEGAGEKIKKREKNKEKIAS